MNQFYKYFGNEYKFEEFLKIFLEKIGLEEVYITSKSNDGGIDLTAVRKGLGNFSNATDEQFYIQAKRYSPSSTISSEKIRALRGSFASGIGMFITTGRVSTKAKLQAKELDPSRPIIVVDGRELVNTCIEKEIGFTFKPVFSNNALDSLMTNNTDVEFNNLNIVERVVTENDIRAYILILPRTIKERIPNDVSSIKIKFENESYKEYKIDAGKRYVGGISKAYKKFGLRQDDGVFVPKKGHLAYRKR